MKPITFLGHSISPHKSHKCDVIGVDGDIKIIKALCCLNKKTKLID